MRCCKSLRVSGPRRLIPNTALTVSHFEGKIEAKKGGIGYLVPLQKKPTSFNILRFKCPLPRQSLQNVTLKNLSELIYDPFKDDQLTSIPLTT